MYANGRGVTQDESEAVKWYRKSAGQGNASAQCNLGVMYDYGKGIKQDFFEAIKWYRKAADQGNASAQFAIGLMYDRGRGFQRNYEEAAIWYRKAISNGHEKAKEFLKVIEKRIAEGLRNAAKLNVLQPNTAVNTVKRVQLWKDGPYWADRNIGAENLWDSGYYFWWGDTIGYKRVNDKWVASDGSVSNYSFKLDKLENVPTLGKRICELYNAGWIEMFKKRLFAKEYVLDSKYDPAQKHWSGNWRMTRREEFEALISKCDWVWKMMNGVNGYIVSGKGDYSSRSIFLPCTGFCCDTLLNNTTEGRYWSSVPGSDDEYRGTWCLTFDSSNIENDTDYYRCLGRCIRPVQDFI